MRSSTRAPFLPGGGEALRAIGVVGEGDAAMSEFREVVDGLPGRARGLRLLRPPASSEAAAAAKPAEEHALALPVLGQVAAGVPIGVSGSTNFIKVTHV